MVGKRNAAEDVVQEAFLSPVARRRRATTPSAAASARGSSASSTTARSTRCAARPSTTRAAPATRASRSASRRRSAPTPRPPAAARPATSAPRSTGLPADQLKVIELAYFGGFTHTEIAEMLDTPLGTVKGRMRLGPGEAARRARRGRRGGMDMSAPSDRLRLGRRRLRARRPDRGGDAALRGATSQTCELCRTDLAALHAGRRRAARRPPSRSTPPPELRERIMSVVEARGASEQRARRAARAEQPVGASEPAPAARARRGVRRCCSPASASASRRSAATTAHDIESTVQCAPRGDASRCDVDDGHGTLKVEGMDQRRPRAASTRCGPSATARTPEPTDALFTVDNDGSASVDVPGRHWTASTRCS